jgi:N-acetyl-beta-hexosaminidase
MKGILSEMMSLFPDKLFHLGLDEIFDDKNCTMESKREKFPA